MLLRLLPWIAFGLLCLPVADVIASIWLAQYIGWWLFVWLLASAAIGVFILKTWRFAAAWALLESMRNNALPIGKLFWVGRTFVAGLLFIFPGPISDVLACLLILPWPGHGSVANSKAAPREGVIEGEFQRVEPVAAALPALPESTHVQGESPL